MKTINGTINPWNGQPFDKVWLYSDFTVSCWTATPAAYRKHTGRTTDPIRCASGDEPCPDGYVKTGRLACDSANRSDVNIELLEALKSCFQWMEFTIPKVREYKHAHTMNWGGPISKARAAITKAGGDLPDSELFKPE